MSPWRWTLLIVSVLGAIAVASLLAEPHDWSEAVHWAEARLRRLERDAAPCPVLAGDVEPGEARALYEQAARAASPVDGPTTDRLRELAAGAGVRDGEDPLAWVGRVPPAALDLLRRAARAEGSLFAASIFGVNDRDAAPFYELLPVADAMLVAGRHGDDEAERLASWLDVLAAGVDLTGAAVPVVGAIGSLVVERAVDAATDDWLRALSPATRARLGDALQRADDALVVREQPAVTVVHLVLLLDSDVALEPADIGLVSRLSTWQHGFSLWRAGVERAEALVADVRRFEAGDRAGEGWSARRARLAELVRRDQERPPERMFHDLGHVLDIETMRRTAAAKLRLLRQAVGFHQRDQLPALADPLGDGPLSVEGDGERLRCASAGAGIERVAER